jgi:hypothetical protein
VSDYTAYMYLGELIEYGADQRHLHEAQAQGNRGLHHRPLRLTVAAERHAMSDKHLSTQFDAELSGISARVLEMGGLVESQVAPAVYALTHFSGDVASAGAQAGRARQPMEVEIDRDLSRSSRAASPRHATCAC